MLAAAIDVGQRVPDDARRYFGPVPPLLAVAGGLAVGFAALRVLDGRDWGSPSTGVTAGSALRVMAIVGVLAASAIAADVVIGFDEDTNVRWPVSPAFYLVMAVVAEVVFHLVPLAAAAWLVGRPPAGGASGRIVVVLALVASIEAVFQVVASRADGDATVLTGFVGVHLLLIGIVQMVVFWQLGPWAMVLVRLAYYVLWHVVWGYLRLRIIF